jgi:glucosyl-3-phosphoglycerate synthase
MEVIDVAPALAPSVETHHHGEWRVEDLVAAKGTARITVCIPARDEVRTIGSIVGRIRTTLLEDDGLVDEILVIDDGSSDGTGSEAHRQGAVVVRGPGVGKGEAMRLARGRADYVVYLDGDVENFSAHFVTGLLGPLLGERGERPQRNDRNDRGPRIVKGCYARPLGSEPVGGGRVTELVAKPLLSLLFPDLATVAQPLAGETALRADVLDSIELAGGYGVEIGLLIDVWQRWGLAAIAQVDLGERRHRNRPLAELGPQAREVISAALARAGTFG